MSGSRVGVTEVTIGDGGSGAAGERAAKLMVNKRERERERGFLMTSLTGVKWRERERNKLGEETRTQREGRKERREGRREEG